MVTACSTNTSAEGYNWKYEIANSRTPFRHTFFSCLTESNCCYVLCCVVLLCDGRMVKKVASVLWDSDCNGFLEEIPILA
jgi:hypothetical protein